MEGYYGEGVCVKYIVLGSKERQETVIFRVSEGYLIFNGCIITNRLCYSIINHLP